MAAILQSLVNSYHSVITEHLDPRSSNWFLTSSPIWPFSIIAVYLLFVNRLGPSLMSNRPPFKLDGIIKAYNIFQIVICSFLFGQGVRFWISQNYNLLCQPVDMSDTEENTYIANLVYTYYLLKISDLLDTVFFIARKKFSQVSFLHVYHHAGMVFTSYMACRFSLNGHFLLLGIINSFVHAVMYSYYLVTIIWPGSKNNIQCKKYITLLQLVQFIVLSLHKILPLLQPECKVQKLWCFLLTIQYFFMIVLFSDFYKKAYCTEKKKQT